MKRVDLSALRTWPAARAGGGEPTRWGQRVPPRPITANVEAGQRRDAGLIDRQAAAHQRAIVVLHQPRADHHIADTQRLSAGFVAFFFDQVGGP